MNEILWKYLKFDEPINQAEGNNYQKQFTYIYNVLDTPQYKLFGLFKTQT